MAFLIIVVAVIIFISAKKNNKQKNPVYQRNLQQATKIQEDIHSTGDYITRMRRVEIKEKYSAVRIYFKQRTLLHSKEETVKSFNQIFDNFDEYVDLYNKRYIEKEKEKLKNYFDDIEGKKLDDQQRTAVITDEYSNLVVASAGSGKTLTILAKVKYLVEKKNIRPDEILLLSFTRKTVEELNERLKQSGLAVEATTFHKLGYDIIKEYRPARIPAVTNEKTLFKVVRSYLKNNIYNHPKALKSFITFMACYINVPVENDQYGSLGGKIDVEKGIDFETFKSKTLDTVQGERVKSVEELIIANFLYLNGVEYEYERPHPAKGAFVYRPDFYLTDYDIYLEHFGIDKDGRAKWLEPDDEEEYVKGISEKRRTHQKYNTKLLETYSHYNRDNILLRKLEEMLKAENVIFKPRDLKEIFKRLLENDSKFGRQITALTETFINLSKSRRFDPASLKKLFAKKGKTGNKFVHERQALFLKFILPILEKYDETLKKRNEIDFNDIINLATDLLRSNEPRYSYRHIIIDEYQDISFSRFSLIKKIRDLSGARLVCVGDDWQSIYRFAGSDISLFSNFGAHVGKYEKLLLEQTYRSSQSLVDIASEFIQKNPQQIGKNPKSRKGVLKDPVRFVTYSPDNIRGVFMNQIKNIVKEYPKKSILVLGRHSFDIDVVAGQTAKGMQYDGRTGYLKVRGFEKTDIRYSTVHNAKGTEADNVIILNLRNEMYGFPNKMADDPILSLLMSKKEDYDHAEERRLFYVALTRTRNKVILLTPKSNASLFVSELQENSRLSSASEGTKCPKCMTGDQMVRRNQWKGNLFVGCTNYPICDYTSDNIKTAINKCPACHRGYMVRRSGKYGDFLGCTKYPDCRKTIKL